MHPVETFELVIAMLAAILALHWLAGRLHWPPSVALLVGGGALAFIPGTPTVQLDPELVLVLFLPPLLMDGAWYTAVARFRHHFIGILSLAVGAVAFTTLVVAVVAHWLMPSLPWAACAALGAIVSPPDAVSARAVLQHVKLPRRLATLLEGESLVNDAAGLVLFRFAVTAALGGDFSTGGALLSFAVLAIGGVAVGLCIGLLWVHLARRVKDEFLLVAASCMVGWVAYIAGESLHVSGVISTVTAGLVLGWYQHVIFTAAVRVTGSSFWRVLIFLLEATVFILIGFSLRGVLDRVGGVEVVWTQMLWPVLAIVAAMTTARFAWVYGSDLVLALLCKAGLTQREPLGPRAATVLGWAGMRGVVTLAVALTLPAEMPGRDFMLVAAFGVILVTVLIQGGSLGLLIRALEVRPTADDHPPMTGIAAEVAMAKARLAVVESLAHGEDGQVIHPRLLEQHRRHVAMAQNYQSAEAELRDDLLAHFDVVLAAIQAAREELVRLHRAEQIDDQTLHNLERDLDLEELGALAAKE